MEDELFPGKPDTALVDRPTLLKAIGREDASHMWARRQWQRGAMPAPIQLPNSNRNFWQVGVLRRWYRDLFAGQNGEAA